MNIYVTHSTKYDFKKELYAPILGCDLIEFPNNIILPHITSMELFNSKELFDNKKCDLVIAEVSNPSLGVGIELGWANANNIPIICICKASSDLSTSLNKISEDIIMYSDDVMLVNSISKIILRIKNTNK